MRAIRLAPWAITALLATTLLLLPSCFRMFSSPDPGREGSPPDSGPGPDGATLDGDVGRDSGADVLGGAGDACESRIVVDASGLATTPIEIGLDAGALTNVYDDPHCGGLPDLLVELRSVENTAIRLSFSDGGAVTVRWSSADPTGCPPSAGHIHTVTSGALPIDVTVGTNVLLFCLSPARGPLVLTVAPR